VGRAVVDAHLHVWDLTRSKYAWLTPEHGELYATFTPEQAHAALQAAGIESAVLVQAEDSERDTGFYWYDNTNIDDPKIKAVLYE
jgi:L-fuconolactonase